MGWPSGASEVFHVPSPAPLACPLLCRPPERSGLPPGSRWSRARDTDSSRCAPCSDVPPGEVFCISSNTSSYPGYNGVKEVPTKLMLVFICRSTGGIPRPSDENSESAYFPKSRVPELIKTPSYLERYHAFPEYTGRPIYLEYVTKPEFKLKLNMLI